MGQKMFMLQLDLKETFTDKTATHSMVTPFRIIKIRSKIEHGE